MIDRFELRTRVISFGRTVSVVALVGAAIGTMVGFAGSWWWGFDLLSHFRAQYLFTALLLTSALLLSRRWIESGSAGLVLVINAGVILPLYCSDPPPPAEGARPLRVVSFNINSGNSDAPGIARYLARADADLIVVMELTGPVSKFLSAQLEGYQAVASPRGDNFGIALYARSPIVSKRVLHLGPEYVPAIEAAISHEGTSYAVLALHTLPPVSRRNSRARDAMLAAAAKWATEQEGHALIVGDLNATPWSHAFRELETRSGFVSSQRGFGLQSSWPRGLWPLSIPIDHCLHSRSLTTTSRHTGSFVGSDHRALHITVAPRPSSPAPRTR